MFTNPAATTIVTLDYAVTVESGYSFSPNGYTVSVKDAIGSKGYVFDGTAAEARALAAALLAAADASDENNA